MAGRHRRPKPVLSLAVIGSGLVLGAGLFLLSEASERGPALWAAFTAPTTQLAASPPSTAAGTTSPSSPPLTAAVDPPTVPSLPETANSASTAKSAPTSTSLALADPPATTEPSLVVVAAAETEIAAATNQLRADLGLPQLALDLSLRAYARDQAWKMAARGALFHSDIEVLLGPWQTVGENLGRDSSADVIFDGLVESSPHYALLADPGFTAIGVGAVIDGSGGLWICQMFAGSGTLTTATALTIPIPTLPLP